MTNEKRNALETHIYFMEQELLNWNWEPETDDRQEMEEIETGYYELRNNIEKLRAMIQ